MCFQEVLQEVQEKRSSLQKVPEALTLDQEQIVYQTTHSRLVQCDERLSFILTFFDESVEFKVCELIPFRKKILEIDLTALLSSSTPDVELIYLPHCERLFAFTIHEVIELRELLEGAFVMLELNSMIHRSICRKMV